MRVSLFTMAAVALVAALSGRAAVAARAQGATTNDGVYTQAQAEAGRELYDKACAQCHQPSKFSGAEFMRAYGEKPLTDIDASMAEMPMDAPGSLTRDDVASLIAYFLSMNKYPAGSTPLKGQVEALQQITVAPRP
jgi:polar amino acid transport system substrate-binding protein